MITSGSPGPEVPARAPPIPASSGDSLIKERRNRTRAAEMVIVLALESCNASFPSGKAATTGQDDDGAAIAAWIRSVAYWFSTVPDSSALRHCPSIVSIAMPWTTDQTNRASRTGRRLADQAFALLRHERVDQGLERRLGLLNQLRVARPRLDEAPEHDPVV